MLNLFWIIIAQRRDISDYIVLYSQIIFAGIFWRLSQSYLTKTICIYAAKPNHQLKDEADFFKKLFAINKVMHTGSLKRQVPGKTVHSFYEILFIDLVSLHAKTCLNLNCLCQTVIKRKQNGVSLTFEPDGNKFYFEYIRDFYQEGLKNQPNSNILKTQLASLLTEYDETGFLTAVQLISNVLSQPTGSEMKILALKSLVKVEAKMQSTFFSDSYGLSIKEVIDYKLAKATFVKVIVDNTKMFNGFWEAYKAPQPKIRQILLLNQKINSEAGTVTKIWEKLSTNFSKVCYRDYITYGLYMRLIRSAPYTSENMFIKYFTLLAQQFQIQRNPAKNSNSLLNKEKMVVCFSMNPKSYGKIDFLSENIHDLGYNIKDLIDQNIATLMPAFFGKKFYKILQLPNLTSSILNKSLPVFMKSKNGYMHSASMYITPYPYLENGVYCIGIFQLDHDTNDYLCIRSNGKIEALSQRFGQAVKIEASNVITHLIDDICVDSTKIRSLINYGAFKNDPMSRNTPKGIMNITRTFTSIDTNYGGETHLTKKEEKAFDENSCIQSPTAQMLSPNRKGEDKNHEEEAQSNLKFFAELENDDIRLQFKEYSYKRNSIKPNYLALGYMGKISVVTHDGDDFYIIKLKTIEQENEDKNPFLKTKELEILQEAITPSSNNEESSSHSVSSVPNERKPIELGSPMASPESLRPEINQKASHLKKRRDATYAPSSARDFPQIKEKESQHITDITQIKEIAKDYLRDQRQNEWYDVNIKNDGDASSTRSSTRAMLGLARTEKAVYFTGKSASYNIVKGALIGLILITIGSFIYYQVQGDTSFQQLTNNVLVLQLIIERLFEAVDTYRRAAIIYAIENGFMDRARHGLPDFSLILVSDLLGVAEVLSTKNSNLRDMVSLFSDKLQSKFYELLYIEQVDTSLSLQYENAFELSSQLASAELRLYAALPQTPSATNADLRFLFNNTMNGLFLHTNDLYGQLMKQDHDIILGMKNIMLYLLLISAVVGIIVILILVRSEIMFIRKKMLFFDYFLRIHDEDVDNVLEKTHAFYRLLKNKNVIEDDIMEEIKGIEDEQKNPKTITKKSQNSKHLSQVKRKRGDFRDINKDIWLGVLGFALFVISFWIAYGVVYLFFVKSQGSFQTAKQQIIETNLLLSRMSESIGITYTYIADDNLDHTFIQGLPIAVEWERNYNILVTSNSFFVGLKNQDFGLYTDEVIALASGDLCTLLAPHDMSCYQDGKGTKRQGLVGINNFFMSTLLQVKNAFDSSDKTNADKIAIYNRADLAEVERVYYGAIIPAYQKLQEIFQSVFLNALVVFKRSIFTINIIFMVVFLVLGRFYWTVALKKMQEEKMHFSEIMRVIPVSIIFQNKFLYNYLERNLKKKLTED